MALVVVCAFVGRSGSTCSGTRSGPGSPPRSSPPSASGSRSCSSSARRTSRFSPTRSARRRSPVAPSARGCSPRSPSPAGSSSGSTPASARPRRRRSAARHVPRAIWLALLSVAALVILNAFAVTLAHPDPAAVVAGRDVDPVTTSVVTSFGSWSAKPFAAVVLVAFLACGTAAQALTARTIFSIARDGVLPASRFLRRVDRRGAPVGAVVATEPGGVPRSPPRPRLRGRREPDRVRHGRDLRRVPPRRPGGAHRSPARDLGSRTGSSGAGASASSSTPSAVAWLAFETVNIAWPRTSLAPPGAPAYQVWAAVIVLAAIADRSAAAYLVVARPQRRLADR